MNINNLAIAACMVLAITACNKQEENEIVSTEIESGSGILSVDVNASVSVNTRGAYSELEASEAVINTAQLLVCRQDGSVARYLADNDVVGNQVSFEDLTLPIGEYKVHAVLNGKDLGACLSEQEMLKGVYSLEDNSDGFIQHAVKQCSITEGQNTSCQLKARRLVARVHVGSIKNNLPPAYGAVTLKNVFLENVSGYDCLDGTLSCDCINLFGRADAEDENTLIDGVTYKAQAEKYTFKAISQSIANGSSYSSPFNLYCYRNDADYDPSYAFDGSATQATKLVLTVNIKGQDYYYPVFVSEQRTIEANKAYSLAITLNNIGSEDPSTPITLSTASISVEMDAWDDGGSQNVEI